MQSLLNLLSEAGPSSHGWTAAVTTGELALQIERQALYDHKLHQQRAALGHNRSIRAPFNADLNTVHHHESQTMIIPRGFRSEFVVSWVLPFGSNENRDAAVLRVTLDSSSYSFIITLTVCRRSRQPQIFFFFFELKTCKMTKAQKYSFNWDSWNG